MTHRDYKPIQFRQLCMVVKTILQRNPEIDDAEWKAKTQETLEKMGFDAPEAGMLSRAMNAVENALRQTVGARLVRPLPVPSSAKDVPPQDVPEPSGRTHRPAGWDIVVALMRRLHSTRQASSGSLPPRPEPQALGITEDEALREFWLQASGSADRVALLQAFAEVAIVRPSGWDYLAVRRTAGEHGLSHRGCFACLSNDRVIEFHHVIQIQHGGSNAPRNRVPLCGVCHHQVHPWLGESERRTKGWTQVGAVDVQAAMRQTREIA